jgi:hypothetical protein
MEMMLDLLRVGIGQPRKPLDVHPDLQIHPSEAGVPEGRVVLVARVDRNSEALL